MLLITNVSLKMTIMPQITNFMDMKLQDNGKIVVYNNTCIIIKLFLPYNRD